MLDKAAAKAGAVQRHELMDCALGQPAGCDFGGSRRYGGEQKVERRIAALQLMHKGQDGIRLSNACRMKPEKRTLRPWRARVAEPLRQPLWHFFSARRPLLEDGHGSGSGRPSRAAIDGEQDAEAPRPFRHLRRGLASIAAGKLISAFGGGVHGGFHLLAEVLHLAPIRVARHIDRLARHHRELGKRQVYGKAAPGGQRDEAACRDCERHDGSPRHPRQRYDAHACYAGGSRRDIGRQGNGRVRLERFQRRPQSSRSAAILAGFAPACAPDKSHVEMQERAPDHLAVGVLSDHVVHRHGFRLDQRKQQELAMPHGHDHRVELFQIRIGVSGFAYHLRGGEHHADVARRELAGRIEEKLRFLQPAANLFGGKCIHQAPELLTSAGASVEHVEGLSHFRVLPSRHGCAFQSVIHTFGQNLMQFGSGCKKSADFCLC